MLNLLTTAPGRGIYFFTADLVISLLPLFRVNSMLVLHVYDDNVARWVVLVCVCSVRMCVWVFFNRLTLEPFET